MTTENITTVEEATEAVAKIVEPVYGFLGFHMNSSDSERIIASLTAPEKRQRKYVESTSEPSISAEEVRKTLWSFGGGTTSAATTSHLFIALGREDELGYLPSEGMLDGYNK